MSAMARQVVTSVSIIALGIGGLLTGHHISQLQDRVDQLERQEKVPVSYCAEVEPGVKLCQEEKP